MSFSLFFTIVIYFLPLCLFSQNPPCSMDSKIKTIHIIFSGDDVALSDTFSVEIKCINGNRSAFPVGDGYWEVNLKFYSINLQDCEISPVREGYTTVQKVKTTRCSEKNCVGLMEFKFKKIRIWQVNIEAKYKDNPQRIKIDNEKFENGSEITSFFTPDLKWDEPLEMDIHFNPVDEPNSIYKYTLELKDFGINQEKRRSILNRNDIVDSLKPNISRINIVSKIGAKTLAEERVKVDSVIFQLKKPKP